MRTNIYSTFFGLCLALMLGTTALAQGVPAEDRDLTPPTDEDLKSGAPVVADLFLYQISTSTIGTSVLEGTFSLLGRMGQENDIVYGVAAYNDEGRLLDSEAAGAVRTLAEGETKELSFSYQIPPYLEGQVTFMLVLENKSGMLLGFRELWKQELVGLETDFSCSQSSENLASVICTSDVATKVVFAAAPRSIFGEPVPVGEGEVTTEEPYTFAPDLKPGFYHLVAAAELGETVIVPIKKEGAYGSIVNIAVYKNVDGKTEVTIPVSGSGLNGATLAVSVTDRAGSVCTERTEVLAVPVFIFTIDDACEAGLITATFTAADGTTFDTKTEPYSTGATPYDPAPTSEEDGGGQTAPTGAPAGQSGSAGSVLAYVFLVLGLLGLAGYLAYRMKGAHTDESVPPTPPVPPTTLALLFGFFALTVPFQSAHALMFHPYLYSTARGEFAWDAWVNVTLDQASYTPGEVAVISAAGTVMSDAGASTGATGNSYAYYFMNSANTYASFDAETTSGMITEIASVTNVPRDTPTGFSGNTTLTIPPTMAPGSHSVRFVRVTVSGGCYAQSGQPCTGDRDIDNSLGFTVVAPNSAPTANAGANRSITLPTTSVTVSGASAGDAEGPVASTVWTFSSGPVAATVTNGSGLTPTFSGMTAAGTYVFRLRVTDSGGLFTDDTMQVLVTAPASSCDWNTTAYLGLNTGNPGMHNTVRCSTPAPSDGTPMQSYCNNLAEDGTTVVCCDSGADCYRYTCDFKNTCSVPVVDLNFQ